MGLGTLLALGTGVSIVSEEAGNAKRQKAIQERMLQNQLSAQQRTMQRQRQIEHIVGAQEAAAGARNIDPGSASFKAIQEDSFNQWAQDQKADNMSLQFQQQALQDQAKQSSLMAVLDPLQTIFQAGTSLYQAHAFDNLSKKSLIPTSPASTEDSYQNMERYRGYHDTSGGLA